MSEPTELTEDDRLPREELIIRLRGYRTALQGAHAARHVAEAKLRRIEELCDEQNRAMPAYLLTSQVRAVLADGES